VCLSRIWSHSSFFFFSHFCNVAQHRRASSDTFGQISH
jgi:hypothetical protein